jgi:predicted RNA-binding protein YlxR (DUF448 family)
MSKARSEATSGSRRLVRQRRCILTREVAATEQLLRFVIAPDHRVVPDLASTLPGRGLWLTASRAAVDRAVAASLFARVSRQAATAAPTLADDIEAGLAQRALNCLGLARRAGQLITGFERVGSALRAGKAAVLVGAGDAAPGGRDKLGARAPDIPHVQCLLVAEMSVALGGENVVHAALSPGGLATRFLVEATKLAAFRDAVAPAGRALAQPQPTRQ